MKKMSKSNYESQHFDMVQSERVARGMVRARILVRARSARRGMRLRCFHNADPRVFFTLFLSGLFAPFSLTYFFALTEGLEEKNQSIFIKTVVVTITILSQGPVIFANFFQFLSKMKILGKTTTYFLQYSFLVMLSKNQPNRTIFDRMTGLFSEKGPKS